MKKNHITTYPIPFPFPFPFLSNAIKEDISITTNPYYDLSNEQIVNQAINLHLKGDVQEAVKYYLFAIKKGITDPIVFSNYGIILIKLGKLKEAEILIRKAIKIKPDYAEAHTNLGSILKSFGNLEEAVVHQRKAIELKPDFAQAYSNLGNILKDLGNLEEAEIVLKKAIELNPDFPEAHSNLGDVLNNLGNLEEAEIVLRKAIELKPDFPDAYLNLGNTLKDFGDLKRAKDLMQKSIELNPYYAEAYSNLGIILKDLGNLKEAEHILKKAIELKPDLGEAYFNLSYIELLNGDYQAGLVNYEFRLIKNKPVIPHGSTNIKRNEGEKLKEGEKLLVISEQAAGDVIFYMRYLLPLKQQGIDVSFCAPKKLHSLIKDSGIHPNPLGPEECNLVTEGEWIPLLSLLKYFDVSPDNPVINTPYLTSTPSLKDKWRTILSNEKKPIIGINWQGRKIIEKSYQGRSIPLEKFSRLLEKNDISFLSLQKGYGSEQMEQCSFKDHFVSCQKQIDEIWDYSETAAIIENCDLIITNDCSIGPLAAGIGKDVWLLLKNPPFWTWGLTGERTFWYPSMRLFRQNELYNWDEIMDRVSNKLLQV